MTKTELIKLLSHESLFKKEDVTNLVNNCLRLIEKELKNGFDITILNFGKLTVKQREARIGHNPQTGEKMNIPAKKTVKFKPSAKLNQRINQ